MIDIIQQLHFLRPEFFWLLPIALGAFISLHLLRSKSSQWYDVVDPLLIEHLLDNPANNQASRRTNIPLIAAALACCIAVIAVAGPSWERLPNVTEQKTDAMIIITDLTLSMHATDVKPSRLIRTRYKLLELLKQRKAGQTALIAYSGDAHVVSPLTDDASTIAALIPSLSPDIMPSIGSNAVAALNSATQLLKNSGISRAKIVWFTDEALPSDIKAIDNILNSKKNSSTIKGNDYQLIIIGIGSKAGGPIPLPSGKFIKDTSGRIVNAPLSRGRLKDIAANAGGVYFDLQSDNSDINAILSESLFDQINSKNKNNTDMPQQKSAPSITDSWRDRGAYIALILLPFTLLAFRRGWILSLILTINISYTDNASADIGMHNEVNTESDSETDTFKWIDLWQTPDQQAYALERQQQHKQAAEQFENPEWKGVAEYQAGNYKDALQTLSALAEKHNSDTSHYNHGHALARNNDLAGAIAAYDKALAINPDMENAKLAKSIVESLQQQQEEQQQDGKEGEEGEEGEKNNEQQSSDQQESDNSEKSESSSDESDSSQQGSESEQESEQGSESDSEASNDLLDRQAEQAQEQDTEKEQQSQQQKDQQAADEESEKNAKEEAASEQAADAKENTEGEAASLEAIEEQLNAEQQAQLEQWLKKIPDDPGGLLRRKFQYERSVRERQGNVIDDREQGQLW